MQSNSEIAFTELAAQGFTYAFEISTWDGKQVGYVYGGGIGFDECREKMVAATNEVARSGSKPLGSALHSIKKFAVNTAPVLMAAE